MIRFYQSINILRFLKSVRVSYLHFTSIIFFLGYFSTNSEISWNQFFPLLAILLSYHLYMCWSNDLPGLECDREDPERALHFLTEGVITPRNFAMITFAQIPILFYLTFLVDANYMYISGAIIFMTIYNYFGKFCKIPPISDACQGISWSFFVLYVASINQYPPTFETFIISLYFFGYIVIINGVHGSLRDVKWDKKNKLNTTPIFFGVGEINGEVYMTKSMRIHSIFCQALLSVVPFFIPLYKNRSDLQNGVLSSLFIIEISLLSLIIFVNFLGIISFLRRPNSVFLIRLHGILLLVPIFLSLGFYLPLSSFLITFSATALSLLLTGYGTYIKYILNYRLR